jgi:hypothetical protein
MEQARAQEGKSMERKAWVRTRSAVCTAAALSALLGLAQPGTRARAQDDSAQFYAQPQNQPAAPSNPPDNNGQPAQAPAPPPPPPAQQPPPPTPQAVAQPVAQGQWVYTTAYGWIWVPAGSTTTIVSGVPYAYLYAPAYGWTWYASPWGVGRYAYGPWVSRPFPYGFRAWVRYPGGWGWHYGPRVTVGFGGGYRGGYGGYRGGYGGGGWGHHGGYGGGGWGHHGGYGGGGHHGGFGGGGGHHGGGHR